MAAPVQDSTYHSNNHHKYTYENRFYQWHLDVFMDRLAAMVAETKPGTLLDAGCGEGFAISALHKRLPDIRYTGLDLSEEAIAYAEAHHGEQARFRTGSVYKLPFSDNSFDTVLCSEVLEHLDDPDRAVAELRRVARNHVIITVPREPYFKWLNDVGQLLKIGLDPGHVNFWTKKTFQDFIRQHFEDPDFEWVHIYQLARAAV